MHSSVLALIFRRKLPKMLLVWLSVLTLGLLVYWAIGTVKMQKPAGEKGELSAGVYGDESIISEHFYSGWSPVVITALFLLCTFGSQLVSLIGSGGEESGTKYTMKRLRISRREVFLWECLSNAVLFLMMWGVLIVLLFLAGRIYMSFPGYRQGAQGISVAVLLQGVYSGLVPLWYPVLWGRNVLIFIFFGILCACARCSGRKIFSVLCGVSAGALIGIIPFYGRGWTLAIAEFTVMTVVTLVFLFFAYRFCEDAKRGESDEGQ